MGEFSFFLGSAVANTFPLSSVIYLGVCIQVCEPGGGLTPLQTHRQGKGTVSLSTVHLQDQAS